MKGHHRLLVRGLGLVLAFGAWACGDDVEPGSTTEQAGTAGAGGSSGQAGSLNLGGSGGAAGGSATAGRAGNASGGGGAPNAGSSSGGASTSGSGGQGGTFNLDPESGGNIAVKIDGQAVNFDQCRLVRGVADGDISIDCKLKSGGNSKMILSLSFTGPGTIDCLTNQIYYADAQSMTASTTGSSGTCSVTATTMPMAKGETFNATFSATLIGTGSSVMLTDGTIAIKAAN